jgi:nitrogen PTS system EIIA component
MKALSRLLTQDRIVWLDAGTKEDALHAMVDVISRSAELPQSEAILAAVLERERLLSTGIGFQLAIPHAKIAGVKDFVVALGVHKAGLPFESLDNKPVHILVMIVGPNSHQEEYLKVLSRVTAFLKENRERIMAMASPEDVYRLTMEY